MLWQNVSCRWLLLLPQHPRSKAGIGDGCMDDLVMMPFMKNRTTPVVLCNRWGSYSINVMLSEERAAQVALAAFSCHRLTAISFQLEFGLSQQTIFCISYVDRTNIVMQTETD